MFVDDSTANVTASAYGLHQFVFTLYQNSCSPPENTDTVLVLFYPKTISTGTSDVSVTIEMQGDCPEDVTTCIGPLVLPSDLAEPNPVYTITGNTNTIFTYFTTESFGDTLNCVVDSVAVITQTVENNSFSSGEVVWNGDNADDVWDEIDDAILQAGGEIPANLSFPSLGDLDSLFCPTLPDTVVQTLDSTFMLLPIKVGAYWDYTPLEDTPDTVFIAFYPDHETFNLDSMIYYVLDSTLISSSPDVWQIDTLNAYGTFQFDWIDVFEYDTLWRYFLTPTLPACPDCDSGSGSSLNLPPPPPQPTCSFIGGITPPDEETEYYIICEWENFVLPDGTVISGWDNVWGEQTHTIEDLDNCLITEYVVYIESYLYDEEYVAICEGETHTHWNGETFSESGYYFVYANFCSETWLNLEVLPLPTVSINTQDTFCGECYGVAEITVSGENAPYTYEWDANANGQTSTTATNLCAGTYTVTVTDANGCTASESIIIIDNEPLEIVSSEIPATCGQNNGEAIVLANNGTPPYSYQWNNGQTASIAQGLSAGTYCATVTDANGCMAETCITVEEISTPNITSIATSGNFEIGEGEMMPNISGGWTPYSYEWSNGSTTANINNLSVGTYCLTVTDINNCTSVFCETVEDLPELSLTVSSFDTFCGLCNGEIDILVSGGTAPYDYAWDNGLFAQQSLYNLCADTYCVTVTDINGTTAETCVTITDSPPLTVNITTTDANCGQCDGTAFINVSGGTAPYSYLWNDVNNQTTQNINNLCAGDYCVTVTDFNGCSAISCTNISNTIGLQVTSTPIDATCGQCNGSITMDILGGTPPYNYLGEDLNEISTSDLCAGTYTVYITDDVGCSATTDVIIEETEGTINETENVTICDWDNYTLVDGTVVSESGEYTVTINNPEGCDSMITTILEVAEPLEINVSSTDASCGQCNGSMDIEIVGGTPPYEYPASWTDWNVEPTDELCAGMYAVLVTDALYCSNSVNVIIEETADLLETPNAICAESTTESITIVWNSIENALAYVVSYENMSDTTTQTSYTITDLDAETSLDISVTAIGTGNCAISEVETISCISGQNNANIIVPNIPNTVIFPTVFSPNEDGQNDNFGAIGKDIKSVSINVYNRWGKLVFESHDLTKKWNGKHQNKTCEIGVYLYQAVVTFEDGNTQNHKGNITLIR